VVAMEILAACQAIDLRREWTERSLGEGTQVAYDLVRSRVPKLEEDRILYPDIAKAKLVLSSGELVRRVSQQVPLN